MTYFFPPPPDPFPIENLTAEQETLRNVYKSMNELSKMVCPVCRVFVPEDELHITDGRVCNKIINLAIP